MGLRREDAFAVATDLSTPVRVGDPPPKASVRHDESLLRGTW